MLYKVNAGGIIDPVSEMHYQVHKKNDPAVYPHVHDFYEVTLITQGMGELLVNEGMHRLEPGCLFLIRPGDIHSRDLTEPCSYINLAFPDKIITEMFKYLDLPDMQKKILSLPHPPKTKLSFGETILLKVQLEKLNLLPVKEPHAVRAELRRLVLDMMLQYFIPTFSVTASMKCPGWFSQLIEKMEEPELFTADFHELVCLAGCTKEHLCRSFRKYLGVPPTAYLNAKRLNYGADMLVHTDHKVIDIAYASGFQSLSRFYCLFKKEFQMTPLEYRNLRRE